MQGYVAVGCVPVYYFFRCVGTLRLFVATKKIPTFVYKQNGTGILEPITCV